MCIVLNILNFVLGGFVIMLVWLLVMLVSIVFIFILLLICFCWEIIKLFLFFYGNEVIYVDEFNLVVKSVLMNIGGILLNIFWLFFFGWWLCLMYIVFGIVQCVIIIGIFVGIVNFKIVVIVFWFVGCCVVFVEIVCVV